MTLPEKDWKYLRSIQKELLNELCRRINKQAKDILDDTRLDNDHARYLALYQHVDTSDEIVGNCFNDWRRSNITLKIMLLQHHKLLTEEHVANLSEEAQGILARL